jgi:hypothetical protein
VFASITRWGQCDENPTIFARVLARWSHTPVHLHTILYGSAMHREQDKVMADIHTEEITYMGNGIEMKGYIAWDSNT